MKAPVHIRRHVLRVRWRLVVSVAVGLVAFLLMPHSWRLPTKLLLAWDALTLVYIVAKGYLISRSSVATCRKRAALYDEGDWIILLVTLGGAMASIAAIVAELAASRSTGVSFPFSVALTVATLALSWTFTHLIFALHYANLYYRSDRNGGHGGLAFPGEREPDYRDFLYYSFVIATSAQTADVATVSPEMRRTTLVHCIVAFVFNSAILALMINIGAGMI